MPYLLGQPVDAGGPPGVVRNEQSAAGAGGMRGIGWAAAAGRADPALGVWLGRGVVLKRHCGGVAGLRAGRRAVSSKQVVSIAWHLLPAGVGYEFMRTSSGGGSQGTAWAGAAVAGRPQRLQVGVGFVV